jgi:mannose/cellobiose epimerase-like protein (N-acyl-D-glucosamine 2-epimerase family)
MLAGATAATAGVQGGATLLDEAIGVWQDRFWDDAAGMAVEEWDRTWSRLDEYRGLNANMHGVEASLAAADATADEETAGRLRTQAMRTTERAYGWARERGWRLPEHFTAAWEPLPDYNRDRPADPFRPFGVTVGHQFEWARLALHVRAATADPPAWLREDAIALFDAAAARGWAADGHDGFPYTLGWDDRPVVGARMHWVLCEAIAAAGVLAGTTGEDGYRDAAAAWREHGERLFADPATGNWHHELTPGGEVGTGTWAGQPDAYHLAQMLLLEGRPVRGSVAAALRGDDPTGPGVSA